MSENRAASLPPEERDGLFDEVRRALEEWTVQTDPDSAAHVEYSLRGFIRRYLRRTPYRGISDTVVAPTYTNTCDIEVNDQIGIKIIYDLHEGSKEWVHKQLRSIFQEYNYLLVYGHQIASKYTDLWRQIERSLVRYSAETRRIRVVGTIDGGHDTIPLSRFSIPGTIVGTFGAYGLFLSFVLAGGHFVGVAAQGSRMGEGFVGMIITFNVVLILMGSFLVRYL